MKKRGYPIRAVSRLTGLSVDTLRAWERRYQAISPDREGRGRIYSEADIERLNLLREAVEKGYSISQIAQLSDEELKEMAGKLFAAHTEKVVRASTSHSSLDQLIEAIEQFYYIEADRELSRLAVHFPPQELVEKVVIPLMHEVGDRWHDGRLSVAQEHMTSSILRNLLGALIRIYSRAEASNTLMFATPSDEQHEFGILAAAMIAAGSGLGVIYLGACLPAEEIIAAAERTKPRVVVIGVKGATESKNWIRDLKRISEGLPKKIELWIGGANGAAQKVGNEKAIWLKGFSDFEQHLARLKREV